MSDLSQFDVVEVQECDAPYGSGNEKWCQYKIANGYTSVVGTNRGSVTETRRYAKTFATELNERAKNGQSVWAPKRKAN